MSSTDYGQHLLDWLVKLNGDAELPASAVKVAIVIACHCEDCGGIEAVASDETIALECGIGMRSVRRARRTLADRAWIKWVRTGRANLYSVRNARGRA